MAPAAALACLLGEPPHKPADAAWTAPERFMVAGTLEALHDWGEAALRDAAEGRPDALHWGDAVTLALYLERLIPAT